MTEDRPTRTAQEIALGARLDPAQAALAIARLELLGIIERVSADGLPRWRATDEAWNLYPRPQNPKAPAYG